MQWSLGVLYLSSLVLALALAAFVALIGNGLAA